MPIALQEAITAMREGRMVIMVDEEKRENEGDLVMAAQFVTPDAVNFMARHGCGLICLSLTPAQIDRLRLPQMTKHNQDPKGTAFTVSIEAAKGVSTGISAADRARTVLVASAPQARPEDVISPGHIFPLRAHEEGVLGREGHTEGSVDLARLAGLEPAGLICEIMAENGTMMRLPELRLYGKRHNLPIISIAALKGWIERHGYDIPAIPKGIGEKTSSSSEVAIAAFPSLYGGHDLKIHVFEDEMGTEHIALVKGEPSQGKTPLVRIHSECVTGDALGSLRCDCGPQLQESLRRIGAAENGVLVYLRGHEGRGIGLGNKIRAYKLQDEGLDTLEANEALGLPVDARNWQAAGNILRALGVKACTLLTNNPQKINGLEQQGVKVVSSERLIIASNPFNRRYLETKRTRMGHFFQES
ncbi:3,4-dihydroxy-2-butanone-4-phosphate synthase [Acetobacteraceae bacterium ESL0709]|nr:3,4-dihydroxy-2-butanone-4-phosphate synthase [Acetobacteraceae bacterium ESL0697]MDF7678981.1 3,4-dihydroxy-2-butanone-4-phosphate synthase [Acetobacteraceae bacterium ESL0709]